MDDLTSYLYEPVKHGVFLARVILKNVTKTLAIGRVESSQREAWEPPEGECLLLEALNDFAKRETRIKPEWDEKLANWLKNVEDVEDDALDEDASLEDVREDYGETRLAFYYSGEAVFGPDIVMSKLDDAVHVTESRIDPVHLLEVTSTKKDGVSAYLDLVGTLGFDKSDFSITLTPVKNHSSRYCSEPFVPAIDLWIHSSSSKLSLPKYLLEYLEPALDYLKKGEWRTSTILSAITVESILAELFEEEFHEVAPDIPVGALHEEIVNRLAVRQNLLDPVNGFIERVNSARIAAVHRGSKQVSQRESIDALRGALRLAIWYYFIDVPRRYPQ
jgi:hypothetical protein